VNNLWTISLLLIFNSIISKNNRIQKKKKQQSQKNIILFFFSFFFFHFYISRQLKIFSTFNQRKINYVLGNYGEIYYKNRNWIQDQLPSIGKMIRRQEHFI
jgi:hypothetical protein